MPLASDLADFAGRLLLAALFLISGIAKIGGYAGTQAYMASAGVPAGLLVIALEIGAAVLVIVGFRTRIAALALAVFTIAAALVFHMHFDDQMQQIMFLKNLAIAGGFLAVAARGPGRWSLDARR